MHRDFRDWPGNRRIEKSATDRHRRDEKGKRKKERGERAAGCRVAPRQRSRIEAPSGHSPIAPETGASIRPDESGPLGNRFSPKGHKMS
jgi:hypothetical protein